MPPVNSTEGGLERVMEHGKSWQAAGEQGRPQA